MGEVGGRDVDTVIKDVFNMLKKKSLGFPKFMANLQTHQVLRNSDNQAGHMLCGLLQCTSLKDRTWGQERNPGNRGELKVPMLELSLGKEGWT